MYTPEQWAMIRKHHRMPVPTWFGVILSRVGMPEAHKSIDAKLSASLKEFRSKHPEWDPREPRPDDPFSYFICVGYYRGLSQIDATYYTAQPHDITSAHESRSPMPAGPIVTEGWHSVCEEIFPGKSNNTPLTV